MKNEVIFEVGDKVIFYKDEHTGQRGFDTNFQTERALKNGYTLEVTKIYTHTDPYFVVCDHKTFNNPYTFDPRDLKLTINGEDKFKVGDEVILTPVKQPHWDILTEKWYFDRAILKIVGHTSSELITVEGIEPDGITKATRDIPYNDLQYPINKRTNLLSEQDLTHDITLGVNPDYYKSESIEVIDFIQAYNLNFSRGNVVKYITRAGKKDADMQLEDLEKAKKYLEFEIDRIKKAQDGPKVKRELDR